MGFGRARSFAAALSLLVTACGATADAPGTGDPTTLTSDGAPLPREQRAVELVAAGPWACARSAAGRIACWGVDLRMSSTGACRPVLGERCPITPAVAGRLAPRWIEGVSGARSLALGGFGAAVLESGDVQVWDLEGDEGFTPSRVEGLTAVSLVALGLETGCAACAGGEIRCWRQRRGPSPARLIGSLDDVIALSADFDTTCAADAPGRVACWGDGAGDVLGDGSARSEEPRRLNDIDEALEVVVTDHLACARRRRGDVACWGTGSPAEGLEAHTDATHLAGSRGRVCAARRSGQVACWGGDSAQVVLARPGLDDVRQIALGWEQGCAARYDGRVACWSDGPVTVLDGLDDVRRVSVGLIGCALRRGGRVACWGPGFGPHPIDVELPR